MPGVPGDLIPPGIPPQVPSRPDSDAPPAINPEIVMSQVVVLPPVWAVTFLWEDSVDCVNGQDGPPLLCCAMQHLELLEYSSDLSNGIHIQCAIGWVENAWT